MDLMIHAWDYHYVYRYEFQLKPEEGILCQNKKSSKKPSDKLCMHLNPIILKL